MNLPNRITPARICLVPVMVAFMMLPGDAAQGVPAGPWDVVYLGNLLRDAVHDDEVVASAVHLGEPHPPELQRAPALAHAFSAALRPDARAADLRALVTLALEA